MRYAFLALLFFSSASATEVRVTVPKGRGGNPNAGNPLGRAPSSVPTGTLGALPGGSGVFTVPGGAPSLNVRTNPGAALNNPHVQGTAAGAVQVQHSGARLDAPYGAGINPAAFNPAPNVLPTITPQDQFKPELDSTPRSQSQLDEIGRELEMSKQAESKGSEGAVSASLDKVFDSAARSGGISLPGAGSVAGKATELKQKVKQFVSVANTAAPRDAPGLYRQAIETAEKGMTPAAAAQVKEAVLASAAQKARLSLGTLANAAYQAAFNDSPKELEKELKGLEKWEDLLGAPGRPLVNNMQRLVGDVRRVAERRPETAPRIHFRPGRAGGYDAVLPLSSVAPVPGKLIDAPFESQPRELALASPDAVVETALVELKRGGGAGALYRAQRKLGASVPMAAVGAGRYWLLTLYNGIVDAVLALFGRGPLSLARGGATVTSGEVTAAQLESFTLYGRLADAETALSWKLSKPGIAWAEARGLLAEAKAVAELHARISGDRNGLRAVESLSSRLERRRELPDADALALARWLGRLRDDALRSTVKSSPELGSNKKIGSWSAALGREGPAVSAAAALLESLPSLSKSSLVMDGPRLWISMPGLKIFVDARGTESGGRLALAAETAEAGKLESDWASAGLSTDRRGKLVLGWLDGETAAAGSSELLSSLIAAMSGASSSSPAVEETSIAPAVAERLLKPEAAETAAVLLANDSSPLSYAVVGEVNAMPALRSRRGKLTITVLRDPLTGQPSRAFAEFAGKPVSPVALGGLLRPQ